MTGFDSKRQAAQDKMNDDSDTLLLVYQHGFADGKKAAQQQAEPVQEPCKACRGTGELSSDVGIPITELIQVIQGGEPPPEWPLIKNILAVFGLDAISFVAKWQAAQRPWQGLTDDEITELDMEISGRTMDECVRAIEDKLKEKNDH